MSGPMNGPKTFRRGVDRTTYRKLGDAGLPIGHDMRASANAAKSLRARAARLAGASQAHLDALAAEMPADARERLELALRKARGE